MSDFNNLTYTFAGSLYSTGLGVLNIYPTAQGAYRSYLGIADTVQITDCTGGSVPAPNQTG